MGYVKGIICLAASRKRNQYCFAGKEVSTGMWVRPVTNHGEHEVSAAEGTVSGGGLAKVGDILDIAFTRHEPFHFQHENYLIQTGDRWRKTGTASYATMESLLDHPGTLWENDGQSWGYENNRVTEAHANAQNCSLWLIRPSDLTVSVDRKGGDYDDAGKRLVKGHFTFEEIEYSLQVTDPIIESRMLIGVNRTETIPNALLCVSLAGAFKGYAYKLIAAIIEPH